MGFSSSPSAWQAQKIINAPAVSHAAVSYQAHPGFLVLGVPMLEVPCPPAPTQPALRCYAPSCSGLHPPTLPASDKCFGTLQFGEDSIHSSAHLKWCCKGDLKPFFIDRGFCDLTPPPCVFIPWLPSLANNLALYNGHLPIQRFEGSTRWMLHSPTFPKAPRRGMDG